MALWGERPASRVVGMLQREVAERALALLRGETDASQTSLLSLMLALSCSSGEIVRRVAPGSFFPPPKVESAILLLSPMTQAERLKRWGIGPERIMQLAKQAFAHPRKQLFSTLGWRDSSETLSKALNIPSRVRPEALSADQWASLAKNGDKLTDKAA